MPVDLSQGLVKKVLEFRVVGRPGLVTSRHGGLVCGFFIIVVVVVVVVSHCPFPPPPLLSFFPLGEGRFVWNPNLVCVCVLYCLGLPLFPLSSS